MKNLSQLILRETDEGVRLCVKAVPGSSRDKLAGVLGDALKVNIAAAPEKGKANQAIARLLAKSLHLAVKDVELVSGPTNPRKEFLLRGLSSDALREKLRDA